MTLLLLLQGTRVFFRKPFVKQPDNSNSMACMLRVYHLGTYGTPARAMGRRDSRTLALGWSAGAKYTQQARCASDDVPVQ